MTDCQRLSFSANYLNLNRKQVVRRFGCEDALKKDLKEMGASRKGLKREALKRLGWKFSLRNCAGLRRLDAELSC